MILTGGRGDEIEEALRGIACRRVDAAATEEIYHTRRNHIWRMKVAGTDAAVKDFKVPGWFNALVYATLRRGKARRSYDNALELMRLGFLSPEPLGWAEERPRPWRLGHSYYACRRLEYDGDMRQWERQPDAEGLLKALGEEMARLHGAGVLHRDFSPGNILFRRSAGGGYKFYYVDLNRMSFGVTSHRRLMRNFRCVNLDDGQTRRLARHYAAAAGLDPDAAADEASRQLAAYLRSKARHRRLKQLMTHSH